MGCYSWPVLIKLEMAGLIKPDVKAWFFFAKIDKKWGNHITSLTGFGAPQTHTQRSYKRSIADYDTDYAKSMEFHRGFS